MTYVPILTLVVMALSFSDLVIRHGWSIMHACLRSGPRSSCSWPFSSPSCWRSPGTGIGIWRCKRSGQAPRKAFWRRFARSGHGDDSRPSKRYTLRLQGTEDAAHRTWTGKQEKLAANIDDMVRDILALVPGQAALRAHRQAAEQEARQRCRSWNGNGAERRREPNNWKGPSKSLKPISARKNSWRIWID